MEPAGNWTLPPDTTAPGVARRIVASALASWRDPDDAVLVASELVTNAVQHGLPPIEFNLHLGTGRLRLTVSNAVGTTLSVPRIVAPGADDPDGRGLAIVETLSTEWGWSDTDRMISVWAELIDSPVSVDQTEARGEVVTDREGPPIPQMTSGGPTATSTECLRQASASTLSRTSRKTVSPEIPRTTAS